MEKDNIQTIRIETVAQSHQILGLEKPKHPLFSILRFEDMKQVTNPGRVRLIFGFYQIVLKKECPGKLRYGQTPYDFDEGVMSFFAPRQVNILEAGDVLPKSGWLLNIHPDFLRTSTLSNKIKDYGFFEYAVSEALILSEEEERSIELIFKQIDREYHLPIDNFSQDVIISNVELLLTYCNRYYNRQFITRKPDNSKLLNKLEIVLNRYFETGGEHGLPTVGFLASQMNLSPKYLSDCIKQLTGQTAQQFIHDRLIERAKEILSTTELSVSEIAYQLGFEYPQSFSKLFRSKTSYTPLEYRQSFN
ncbi:helix-turn-helix domain-containing protein [Chryseosolibacter indicus]|uniref:Helix-turn-helix transcriptional regulator n=1 Tax=Chryseosolibacter indicus TaxID=2782351 RepID=A0ABS5VW16_9BACT|nr:AraC family transcriptional regulator [Chryseosolibacter indicus]MBT1705617.1 helix-turn-helix transcriptional regulator [Chryseosolibacter indicus]